jgi:hypothetical protein
MDRFAVVEVGAAFRLYDVCGHAQTDHAIDGSLTGAVALAVLLKDGDVVAEEACGP